MVRRKRHAGEVRAQRLERGSRAAHAADPPDEVQRDPACTTIITKRSTLDLSTQVLALTEGLEAHVGSVERAPEPGPGTMNEITWHRWRDRRARRQQTRQGSTRTRRASLPRPYGFATLISLLTPTTP